jgi:hypothetical protein
MSKVSNCFQYSPLSNPLTKCHKGEQKKRKIKGFPRAGKGGWGGGGGGGGAAAQGIREV